MPPLTPVKADPANTRTVPLTRDKLAPWCEDGGVLPPPPADESEPLMCISNNSPLLGGGTVTGSVVVYELKPASQGYSASAYIDVHPVRNQEKAVDEGFRIVATIPFDARNNPKTVPVPTDFMNGYCIDAAGNGKSSCDNKDNELMRQAFRSNISRFDSARIGKLLQQSIGARETAAPAPVDTDGDGIADAADNCPNDKGPVSNNGCPVKAAPAPAVPPVKVVDQVLLGSTATINIRNAIGEVVLTIKAGDFSKPLSTDNPLLEYSAHADVHVKITSKDGASVEKVLKGDKSGPSFEVFPEGNAADHLPLTIAFGDGINPKAIKLDPSGPSGDLTPAKPAASAPAAAPTTPVFDGEPRMDHDPETYNNRVADLPVVIVTAKAKKGKIKITVDGDPMPVQDIAAGETKRIPLTSVKHRMSRNFVGAVGGPEGKVPYTIEFLDEAGAKTLDKRERSFTVQGSARSSGGGSAGSSGTPAPGGTNVNIHIEQSNGGEGKPKKHNRGGPQGLSD